MTRQLPSESDIPLHGWPPYSAIHRERIRAHAKHEAKGGSAEQTAWNAPIFLAILMEEVGEVARVFNEFALGEISEGEAQQLLYKELIQVGAMTAAWIDATEK